MSEEVTGATEHPLDDRSNLVAAYARWARTHDPAVEWAWEALHDGIWWIHDPLEMLDVIVAIIDQIKDDPSALGYVGAGPLEDLLGGRDDVMARAEQEARGNRAFRIAAANVTGVRFAEPGYEGLHDIVRDELVED